MNGALKPTVTYYLNRLQRLDADEHYCVTLNRVEEIDPERVIMRTVYDHPLYTLDTLRGQREVEALTGAGPYALRRRASRQRLPRGRARLGRPRRRRARSRLVKSALYTGTLIHSRREPARNTFRYPISFFVLDLDELPELERRLALFSVNRRNLVTLRDEDHFDGTLPVSEAAARFCAERGVEVERVLMLAQLRVLGYVFNPVSFHWCYGPDGQLAAMIAELSNTFGERLPELLHGPALTYEHEKRLHVSPFFGLDQAYEYAFSEPEEEVWARVHVREDGRVPLSAVLHGRREELTNTSLARALVRYPLMPMQVTALIHWQALKLWAKRVPFHHKPPVRPGQGVGAAVSTVERTVRAIPPTRGGGARAALRSECSRTRSAASTKGTLVARLPDGSERTLRRRPGRDDGHRGRPPA